MPGGRRGGKDPPDPTKPRPGRRGPQLLPEPPEPPPEPPCPPRPGEPSAAARPRRRSGSGEAAAPRGRAGLRAGVALREPPLLRRERSGLGAGRMRSGAVAAAAAALPRPAPLPPALPARYFPVLGSTSGRWRRGRGGPRAASCAPRQLWVWRQRSGKRSPSQTSLNFPR